MRLAVALVCLPIMTFLALTHAQAPIGSVADAAAALVRAYPDFLDRTEANDIIWKDGTRMPIDDRKGAKSFDAMLDDPDIKDMFSTPYPLGATGLAPAINFDPGRVRYLPLLKKMYGDCQATGFMSNAANVVWLPGKDGESLEFTKLNGAAAALQRVSDELDKLPERFLEYLRPAQGTYNCRPIAGTNRRSAHSFGIAIDIAAAHSDYWLWSRAAPDGRIAHRNEVPLEIVRIFEQHGFIWGGKWYHYDTMHFEYRPEIIAVAKTLSASGDRMP
jgi:hypothetical protein